MLHELALPILQILAATMLAILFLQSGLDKVTNWSGNLSWLKDYFSKTFMSGMVTPMLGILTLFELASGVVSAAGVVVILMFDSTTVALGGALLSSLTVVFLFFGQRLAKDYEGAANLVGYFLLGGGAVFLMV